MKISNYWLCLDWQNLDRIHKMNLGIVCSWIVVENFLFHSEFLETYSTSVVFLCFPIEKKIRILLGLSYPSIFVFCKNTKYNMLHKKNKFLYIFPEFRSWILHYRVYKSTYTTLSNWNLVKLIGPFKSGNRLSHK